MSDDKKPPRRMMPNRASYTSPHAVEHDENRLCGAGEPCQPVPESPAPNTWTWCNCCGERIPAPTLGPRVCSECRFAYGSKEVCRHPTTPMMQPNASRRWDSKHNTHHRRRGGCEGGMGGIKACEPVESPEDDAIRAMRVGCEMCGYVSAIPRGYGVKSPAPQEPPVTQDDESVTIAARDESVAVSSADAGPCLADDICKMFEDDDSTIGRWLSMRPEREEKQYNQ